MNEIATSAMNILRSIALSSSKQFTGSFFCFLAGSKVEGLATKKSDFDVYAISAEGNFPSDECVFASEIGIIEVTTMSENFLQRVLAQFEHGFSNGKAIDQYHVLLAHRLLTGIAILNEERFLKIKHSISSKIVANYLAHYNIALAEKCFFDSLGNIEVNDENSAIFNADRTVHHSLDHFLALRGNTSPLVKWRHSYAKNILGENHPVYIRYMELISDLPTGSNRKKRRYVEDVGRFYQTISDNNIAHSYFQIAELRNFESRLWGSDATLPARIAIRKQPCARLFAKSGKYFLMAQNPLFEVSQIGLRVWIEIDNYATQDEIILSLTEKNNLTTAISKEAVLENLMALKESYLLY